MYELRHTLNIGNANHSEASMFQVSLTNFGTKFSNSFATFEQAVEFAKSKGFECTIHSGNSVAGTWSPIGGSRQW
jgi:hypothetical protein